MRETIRLRGGTISAAPTNIPPASIAKKYGFNFAVTDVVVKNREIPRMRLFSASAFSRKRLVRATNSLAVVYRITPIYVLEVSCPLNLPSNDHVKQRLFSPFTDEGNSSRLHG